MKLEKNQNGAASLLTVIFIAIILSILTVGFIRIAINEQRQATDDDLTTRAFFAAESGVEDAKRAIKENIKNPSSINLNGNDCAPPGGGSGYSSTLSSPSNYDIEYTCQLIELTPNEYKAHLDGANQTIQFPINTGGATWNRITIKWHINETTINGGDGTIPPVKDRGAAVDLPTVTNWGTNDYPAMLDVGFFSHPTDPDPANPPPTYNRSDIYDYRALLSPNSSGSLEEVFNGTGLHPGAKDGEVIGAECTIGTPAPPPPAPGDYLCVQQFQFDGSLNRQHYVRLGSLYRGTHLEIEVSQGGGGPLPLYGAQAVIDVTGRAGDVYRRVETTVDLEQSLSLLPDFAIISAHDICKDFGVTNDIADFTGRDDTSCTILSPSP